MNPINQVKQDLKRLDSLLDKYSASKAIEGLVPDAYANGQARVRFSSRFPHKERQDFTVTINDEHVFEGDSIPDALWNDHVARKRLREVMERETQPTNNES
jgi:hypothetical protein